MSTVSACTEAWLSPPSSTFQFYTRTWAALEPRAVVVFVHGFAEHISRNGYNIAFTHFASKGVTVFAFDQRGFGHTAIESEKRHDGSYGRTSGDLALNDIDWALNHAKNKYPNLPVFLFGHSMVRVSIPVHSVPAQTVYREVHWL
jgi:acylglycerol lipase